MLPIPYGAIKSEIKEIPADLEACFNSYGAIKRNFKFEKQLADSLNSLRCD